MMQMGMDFFGGPENMMNEMMMGMNDMMMGGMPGMGPMGMDPMMGWNGTMMG